MYCSKHDRSCAVPSHATLTPAVRFIRGRNACMQPTFAMPAGLSTLKSHARSNTIRHFAIYIRNATRAPSSSCRHSWARTPPQAQVPCVTYVDLATTHIHAHLHTYVPRLPTCWTARTWLCSHSPRPWPGDILENIAVADQITVRHNSSRIPMRQGNCSQ